MASSYVIPNRSYISHTITCGVCNRAKKWYGTMLGQEASPQHFCSQHRKTEYRCCRGKEESPSSPFPIVNLYLSSTHNRKASILDSSVALYAIAYSLIIQHPRTVYLPSLPKQHKMQHTVIYLKEQPGAYWSDSGRLQFL